MLSSDKIYVVLNENETLYWTKNRDFQLYKTKEGLAKKKEKYAGKKIAVFSLETIENIDDLFVEE